MAAGIGSGTATAGSGSATAPSGTETARSGHMQQVDQQQEGAQKWNAPTPVIIQPTPKPCRPTSTCELDIPLPTFGQAVATRLGQGQKLFHRG